MSHITTIQLNNLQNTMSETISFPLGSKTVAIDSIPAVTKNYRYMVFMIPDTVMQPNATRFGQFKLSDPMSRNYRLILHMFLKISENISWGSQDFKPLAKESDRMVPGIRNKLTRDGPALRFFVERVVDRDGNPAGWRFFIVVTTDPETFSIGVALSNMFILNEKEFKKMKSSAQNPRMPETYNSTKEPWKALVDNTFYVQRVVRTYLDPEMDSTLCHVNNPDLMKHMCQENYYGDAGDLTSYSPMNVFNAPRAIDPSQIKEKKFAARYRADPSLYDTDQFKIASYLQGDGDTLVTFPDSSKVWEIDTTFITHENIDRMQFPHITEEERGSNWDPMSNYDTIDKYLSSYFNELDSNPDFVVKNDIAKAGVRNFESLTRLDSKLEAGIISPEDYERERRTMIAAAQNDFSNMWSDGGNLSPAINEMVRWYDELLRNGEKIGDPFTPFLGLKMIDNTLSPFANMVASFMIHLETTIKVASVHSIVYLCFLAAMDCYHFVYDLKLNVLMVGPGQASKSFVINVVEKMLIPSTTESVTHETKKARATEDEQVNVISLYDEAPTFITGHDKSNGETGDPIVKSSMSKGRIDVLVFSKDDAVAKRRARYFSVDVMRTIITATNEPLSSIHEAQLSRFWPLIVSTNTSNERNITNAMVTISKQDKTRKEKFILFTRLMQYFTAMTFKAIQARVLPEVDLTIPMYLFGRYATDMLNGGFGSMHPRLMQRMLSLARILTIQNAIYTMILSEHSPFKDEPEFNVKMLFNIAPMLVCNEEISNFVFTFCAEQIVSSIEHEVVIAILVAINSKATNGGGDKDRFFYEPDPQGFGAGTIDYNYYSFKYSGKAVSVKPVAHAIKNFMDTRATSTDNIESVLVRIRERVFQSPEYTSGDAFSDAYQASGSSLASSYDGDHTRAIEDMGIVDTASIIRSKMPSESERKKGNRKQIIEIDTKNGCMKILRSYVEHCAESMDNREGDCKHPLEKMVRNNMNCFTRCRRTISGITHTHLGDLAPHVFNTILAEPVPGRYLKVRMSNAITECERQIIDGMDIDDSKEDVDVCYLDDDIETIIVSDYYDKCKHYMDENSRFEKDDFMPRNYECTVEPELGEDHKYPDKYISALQGRRNRSRTCEKRKDVSNGIPLSALKKTKY